MPKIGRVVVPGMPHHVTQRGNRRMEVRLDDQDRNHYLSLVAKYAQRDELAIWAYCLMANHVHFVVVPASAGSLGRTFRDAHRRHAVWMNRKLRQMGHLWQGRFYSSVLDDAHLWVAVRYVERNPVRAGLVERAGDWPWSSAAAHCGWRTDALLSPVEMPWPVPDWSAYLREEEEVDVTEIRDRTAAGKPCGSHSFVEQLESALGRILQPRKRGPKKKIGRAKQ